MEILKKAGLVLMLLASLLLVHSAANQPDITRIIVGLFGFRLWLAGLVLALSIMLLAAYQAWRLPRSWFQTLTLVTALLSLSAAIRFGLNVPDYQLESVRYASGDIELAGELYLPAFADPGPAVVLVHGSAPFPRATYDLWADFLAKNGVAVLLVDKRGVRASGGKFESENNGSLKNLSNLADDVVAGVDFLATRSDIDKDRIGLYGISQGGWVGVLAARKTSAISFIVMNSGPTVSVGEEGTWSDLRGDDHGEALVSMEVAEAEIRRTKPYHYDPRADLAELNIPGLWLFAAEDNSIPSRKSIKVLDKLIENGKPFSHRTYSGVGHVLLGGPLRVDEQSWADTAEWLAKL